MKKFVFLIVGLLVSAVVAATPIDSASWVPQYGTSPTNVFPIPAGGLFTPPQGGLLVAPAGWKTVVVVPTGEVPSPDASLTFDVGGAGADIDITLTGVRGSGFGATIFSALYPGTFDEQLPGWSNRLAILRAETFLGPPAAGSVVSVALSSLVVPGGIFTLEVMIAPSDDSGSVQYRDIGTVSIKATPRSAAVPEPPSAALFAVGLILFFFPTLRPS